MMESTAEIHHEEQYPENTAIDDPAATAQHDGMNDMGSLPLSHAVREGEVAEMRKEMATLQDEVKLLRNEVDHLKLKLSSGRMISNQQGSGATMMELDMQNGPLPELASAPPASVPMPGNHQYMQGMSQVAVPEATNLQAVMPGSNNQIPQHDAGREQYAPNSVQFDGLITLGHAAEHAASDGMQKDHKSVVPRKRAHSTPSLQLDLDEEDVIEELKARGLVIEEPAEDPKTFRGGRPPLGMGPYKRVKEMYDKRMITMESWRVYYADKCRESGYDGAFRKDLRPRLNHPKATTRKPRQSFPPVYLEPPPLPSSARYQAPPNVMDLETKILKQLCRELDYPAESAQETRFAWNKQMTDQENVEALRDYLMSHRPAKMRRGKKPEGITRFPIVFDLWSLSLVESSQFKRIAKYAGVDFSMPLHAINPGMDDMYQQGAEDQPHDMQQAHDMHMVPPPGELQDMSRMLERGMDAPSALTAPDDLNHGDVPQPPMADHEMAQEHAPVPMTHEAVGLDQAMKVDDPAVPPVDHVHVEPHAALQHPVPIVDHSHAMLDHGVVGHPVPHDPAAGHLAAQVIPQLPIVNGAEQNIPVLGAPVSGAVPDPDAAVMADAIVPVAAGFADQQCA